MKYILLDDNKVKEIIPEEDPIFPGVPIKARYAPDFVAQLLPVEDEVEVEQNWVYAPEDRSFAPAPEPEPEVPPPEPETYMIAQQEIDDAYREGVDNV